MKQLKLTTKNLLTSWKRHDDDKVEFLGNLLKIKPSIVLMDGYIVKINERREKRYLTYMFNRIEKLISIGKPYNALYITFFLMNRSQSFRDYTYLSKPIVKSMVQIMKIEKLRLDGWIRKLINEILSKLELIIGAYICLLIGGANPTVEAISIVEIVKIDENQILPFITCSIIIWTILLILRKEEVSDLPISGPMTEVEYAWLQDTLSCQAWLDNLAISPIGELWNLPF